MGSQMQGAQVNSKQKPENCNGQVMTINAIDAIDVIDACCPIMSHKLQLPSDFSPTKKDDHAREVVFWSALYSLQVQTNSRHSGPALASMWNDGMAHVCQKRVA